jgi:hypothetical integral membrane protein (TIGR02206 family)
MMMRQTPPIFPVFHTFNIQHLITLGTIAVLCFIVAMIARKGSGSQRKWLRLSLGILLLGYMTVLYVRQGLGHALSLEYSLPLELCSLVLIASTIAIFWSNRLITEIAYFWGMGGVLQATLTPDLALGFPSWDFIFFFWGHGATLLAIVFLISRPEFKPGKGSILQMMIALNIYALVVGTVDKIMGWNYGYLCRKPAMPSLLDFLGPWPWYLLSLEAIAFMTFLILSLPWRFRASSRRNDRALSIGG